MHYLYYPDERTDWVAIHSDLARGKSREQIICDLRRDLSGIQVWFSDLDESDVPSQARRIAFDRFLSRFCRDEIYRNWVLRSAQRCLKETSPSYGEVWHEYITTFLRDRDELIRLREYYTPEMVRRTLFPGVKDFYTQIIPHAEKYYVTRNIHLVANFFATELGFPQHVFSEVQQKGQHLQNFIESHSFTSYGCSGDSDDDEEMHDILKFYQGKGRIGYSRTLFIAENKHAPHPKFDMNCSRDRRGLVELLTIEDFE